MKVIQLRKNVIEIPFQDEDGKTVLTLEFDRTDENKKRLDASFQTLQTQIDEFQEKGNDVSIDEAKKIVEDTCDSFLGKGSFEKMYKLNPSVEIVVLYLYQIAIGIKEELEEEDLKAVESKYLS